MFEAKCIEYVVEGGKRVLELEDEENKEIIWRSYDMSPDGSKVVSVKEANGEETFFDFFGRKILFPDDVVKVHAHWPVLARNFYARDGVWSYEERFLVETQSQDLFMMVNCLDFCDVLEMTKEIRAAGYLNPNFDNYLGVLCSVVPNENQNMEWTVKQFDEKFESVDEGGDFTFIALKNKKTQEESAVLFEGPNTEERKSWIVGLDALLEYFSIFPDKGLSTFLDDYVPVINSMTFLADVVEFKMTFIHQVNETLRFDAEVVYPRAERVFKMEKMTNIEV